MEISIKYKYTYEYKIQVYMGGYMSQKRAAYGTAVCIKNMERK